MNFIIAHPDVQKKKAEVFFGYISTLGKVVNKPQEQGRRIGSPVKEVFLFSSSCFYFSKRIVFEGCR